MSSFCKNFSAKMRVGCAELKQRLQIIPQFVMQFVFVRCQRPKLSPPRAGEGSQRRLDLR